MLVDFQRLERSIDISINLNEENGFAIRVHWVGHKTVFLSRWLFLSNFFPQTTVRLYPFQIHSIALSTFASIVGPFGGFFASGFKRAFKIKVRDYFCMAWAWLFISFSNVLLAFSLNMQFVDTTVQIKCLLFQDFANTIPGHGGIMDRFDCQYLMATFVNVYIASFIR